MISLDSEKLFVDLCRGKQSSKGPFENESMLVLQKVYMGARASLAAKLNPKTRFKAEAYSSR